MESKFTLPVAPPASSHFTLPPFFSQMPVAINSSHSLPASPSRPPPGFTATPLKFFPIAASHGRTTDDLDLLKSQRKMCETIHEVGEETEGGGDTSLPPEKRQRLDEQHQREGAALSQAGGGVLAMPTRMGPLTGPQVQYATQPPSLQFLPISLMSAATPPQQQNLLRAQISSFLPQSYFNRGGGGEGMGIIRPLVAGGSMPPQQKPVEARNANTASRGGANEG